MDTETTLVTHAQRGDTTAFDELARRSRPWLFGLCLRLVRDHGTAEDLVQEALVAAFQRLGQLRDPSRFRHWLGAIAVNACRMHLRRLGHLREEPTEPGETDPSLPPSDDAPGHVESALNRIDPTSKRMLVLAYVMGLTHAEIADLFDLSTAATKSRLHRARERLRKEMIHDMTPKEKARVGVVEEPWALRTIMLVEPDESLRESVRAGLTAAGYGVMVLPTGEAAVAAAAQRQAQMLVLDKHCGEPHWLEVLLLLQVDAWARDNIPISVLVDPDNERDVFLAWQAGAAVCLTRPPATDELVRIVKKLETAWPEELRPQRVAG